MHSNTKRYTAVLLTLAFCAALLPGFAAAAAEGKVNVNQAGAEELALLPRIGPSTAGRIVEFREENGPFRALEDLMLVRGIGEKTFELLEPYVALEGETTLTEKVRVPRRSQESDE
jgi:competence protein ComEA